MHRISSADASLSDAELYKGIKHPEPYASFLQHAVDVLGIRPAVAQAAWDLRRLRTSDAREGEAEIYQAQREFVHFVATRQGETALDQLCQYLDEFTHPG